MSNIGKTAASAVGWFQLALETSDGHNYPALCGDIAKSINLNHRRGDYCIGEQRFPIDGKA